MKGSTTSVGRVFISAFRQHKSKSPAVMSLLSTKTLYSVLRPSSISVGTTTCALRRNSTVSEDAAMASDSVVGCCTALLARSSICFSANRTSLSSGRRCNTVSYSRMADDNCPCCRYAWAIRLEVLTSSSSRPSFE